MKRLLALALLLGGLFYPPTRTMDAYGVVVLRDGPTLTRSHLISGDELTALQASRNGAPRGVAREDWESGRAFVLGKQGFRSYAPLASQLYGAIVAENTNSTSGTGVGSLTFSVTVSGSDTFIFVVAGIGEDGANHVSGVTYAAEALSNLWQVDDGGTWVAGSGWGLVDPTTGANNVVVTIDTSATQSAAGGTAFSGVDQTTPTEGANTASGSASPAAVTISSESGDLVACGVASDDDDGFTAGGTELWQQAAIDDDTTHGAQTYAGSASVNCQWTTDNENWAAGGVNLNAEGAAAVIPHRIIFSQ